VIAVVAIVFLMYGPKKIPELAKSIGLARKEFNDASKAASGESPATTSAAAPAAVVTAASTGDVLIDTAKKLGISTEGKTRDQISAEIVARAQTS
jgi:sec-independent protein translocase protein TatA